MEYLLKSILCLLILLLFHRLVLQQEVLYRFNRFFLLTAVIGSFLIPLVTIEIAQEVAFAPVPEEVFSAEISSGEPFQEVDEMPVLQVETSEKAEVQIPWMKIGWTVYLIGVVVFLVRFLRNLQLIFNQVNGNLNVTYRQETLVLIPELVSPFSFLKYIFYSKNAFEKGGIPEAVFLHEQCHVRERHSWDVMFIEALLVVFWFHPGLYLARQAVKLNHEFIADQQVIQRLPVSEYQSLLLAILSGQQGFALGSSLNFSLTKKRFEMMNRKVNKSSTWMKTLSVVPILAGLIYLFSDKIPAQSEGEKKRKVSLEMENSPKEKLETHILIKSDGQLEVDGQLVKLENLEGLIESKYTTHDLAVISTEPGVEMGQLADVQEALRNQNVRQVVYQNSQATSQDVALEEKRKRHFRDAIFLIESTDMEYTQKSYEELAEKEKILLLFMDKPVDKKSPDSELFEQWKNEKEFAVWIDGKSVANTVLSKYQAKYFVKWFQSGVKANARSVRFPQPFQVHLYSPKYFEESFGPNSDMFRPRTNRDTITITQRKMTSMKDLSRYPDPVTAYLQKNARYEKLKSSPEVSSPEVKAEIQQLFEELEDAYSKTPENRKHRLKKPTPPQTSDSKILSFEPGLADYVSRYATYQTKINKSGFFSSFSQLEMRQLEKEFHSLESNFAKLPLEEKMQTKRPSFPFAKLTQEGKVIYKKLSDLTEEEKKNMAC